MLLWEPIPILTSITTAYSLFVCYFCCFVVAATVLLLCMLVVCLYGVVLLLQFKGLANANPGIFVRGGPGQSDKKSSDNVVLVVFC